MTGQRFTIIVSETVVALLVAACADAPRSRTDTAATHTAATAETAAAHPATDECAPSIWEGVDTARTRKVTRHAVNRATHGMFSQVRWALSPDGCTMLVVEDPAAVEADPVPNGFLLASERGPMVFQRDGVWDVSPSADWERLAYARAFGTQPRGPRDSLSRAEWQQFARRVGLDQEAVRRATFSCSGMTYAYCVARLHVAERGTEHALPVLAGWRVRWSADGTALLAGVAPAGSQDHAPATRWLVVDARTAVVRDTVGAADTTGITPLVWSTGPMLSYGLALDLASPSELRIPNAVIRSEGGWIHARWLARGGAEQSFRVGIGRALAATRGGHFIAAVVPRRPTPPLEWAYDLVVYQTSK